MGRARWIKIYESIKDSAVWSDSVRLKAWLDILISANYKDKEWFHNGQAIKIRRGQFVTSIRKLAESWGCSKDTVRRILKQFEEFDMIRHNSDTGRYTIVTVVKYEDFQDAKGIMCDTDKDTDADTDKDSDKYSGKDSDKDTDTTQHKNNKNIQKRDRKKNGAAPPSGVAPDKYGVPPDGWTDEYERRFQEDAPYNPGKTRQDWYEFWVLPAEDGDDG